MSEKIKGLDQHKISLSARYHLCLTNIFLIFLKTHLKISQNDATILRRDGGINGDGDPLVAGSHHRYGVGTTIEHTIDQEHCTDNTESHGEVTEIILRQGQEVKHKHNTGLGDRPTHGRQATAKQTREVRSRRASDRASSLLGGLRRTDARPARQARHRRSAVRQRAELY